MSANEMNAILTAFLNLARASGKVSNIHVKCTLHHWHTHILKRGQYFTWSATSLPVPLLVGASPSPYDAWEGVDTVVCADNS